jgi:hypothetical protein
MSASIGVTDPQSRTGVWIDLAEKPAIPDENNLRSLAWSKRALSGAWGRSANSTRDAFLAWTAAVEGVWWVLALDEHLDAHIGMPYREARDQDPYGKVVAGMRWLRNRHAHEIMVTGRGGAKKSFFGTPGSIVFISPSNRWKLSADINPRRDRSKPELRELYDVTVAGLALEQSLEQATIWFDRVFSACGFPDLHPPTDPTIL